MSLDHKAYSNFWVGYCTLWGDRLMGPILAKVQAEATPLKGDGSGFQECNTRWVYGTFKGNPPRKPTCHWNIKHLKMYFLLRMVIFHCHVSFLGGDLYISSDILWIFVRHSPSRQLRAGYQSAGLEKVTPFKHGNLWYPSWISGV